MEIITVEAAVETPPPKLYTAEEISPDFLRDESRLEGSADCAVFPASTEEVSAALKWAANENIPVTVSGGRTGIAGGAVPEGGLLLSLARMQKIFGIVEDESGKKTVSCQTGVLLSEIRDFLIANKCKDQFPPDPTETSATIGGMIACNASGAHTFRYGPTRDYIEELTAVLADGQIIKLKRGSASGSRAFTVKSSGGCEIVSEYPSYAQPETKNAAGYYSGENMQAIDLLIGSEGTLAVVTEAKLKLVPSPEFEFNAMCFVNSEAAAVELTNILRETGELEVTAVEYFDPGAIEMLRRRRKEMGPASAVPPGMPEGTEIAGICTDIACKKDEVADAAKKLDELTAKLSGGKPVVVWAAFDKDERERLRKFRHALPETVNTLIAERRKKHREITKLGTDMAVPDEYLAHILQFYRKELDSHKLEYVMFGHIGNNHIHVNILPRNPSEYLLGKQVYMDFAEEVLKCGGSISAEHGIGKLKKQFLSLMLKEAGLHEMRRIKEIFDPELRLGPGALI